MADSHQTVSKGKAKTMAELMAGAGKNIHPLQKGEIVEGIVKKISPKEILLDIGAKGDALVLEYDKKNMENLLNMLKLGDKVKASVLSPESEEGYPVVSLRRTLEDAIFSTLESHYAKDEIFEVMVSGDTRGGFFVETKSGIQGFLPNSQVLEEEDLSGKKINVKIIEFDRNKKRVIFSQKATLYNVAPDEMKKYAKKGDTFKAEVYSLTPYGMYMTVRPQENLSMEGFVHISEVSHDRVEDLESLYKPGDIVDVQVLDIDTENRRVNLSIKQLTKDTFTEIQDQYKKEQKVKGKVVDVKTRGVTIEIEPNVKGFIPAAKIPSSASYTVGDMVEAEVTDFDTKRRLIVVTPVLKAIPIGYR